ncbi:uncharacterized protein LOC135846022 isoform X2 [Planococcus citri]|uniref:uncharacterized protein LOC135846022 isoform X2 n=1 Tax=Planococcus citri TaxID=170843 RepID=UPI0031F8EF6B
MLGVFKRRWRPKSAAKNNNGIHTKNNHLVTNYNLYSEPVLSIDGQFDKIISTSNRQIHSLCEEKAQLAVTYETIKSLPASHTPSAPPPLPPTSTIHSYTLNVPSSPVISENESPTLSVNRTANICVEDGRIEFVKENIDSVHANNNNNHIQRDTRRHSRDEKIDNAKECLESRIAELEKSLEAERKLVQREKLTVARLQRQLSRRELIQRDVDRERRLRLDSEARLRRSESDTERCRAKLAVLQREFIRMEDTVRSMLQYKTKYEQLKQDKTSLTIACENHIQHFQNIICKIKEENEELKKQLQSLNASEANSEVQSVLLERIEILQNQNSKLMKEGESQRKQYEKCLDDVANQVVKALLTQKNLQEDVNRLQQRVKELESSNSSLSSLLLQRIHRNNQSHSNTSNTNTFHSNNSGNRCCQTFACLQSSLCSQLDVLAKKADQQRPVSLDERRLQKIWNKSGSNSFVWLPLQRPQSLNLETSSYITNDKIKKETEEESPESGNRDEGYSTMSSDVQGTSEIPHKTLEELKEVTDESDSVPFRLSLDTKMIRSRNSFPPVTHLLPYQHIMRSFSDSQLCLRITTGSCALSPFKSSSNKCHNQPLPLLRTKFSSLLEVALREENTEDGFSFCSSDLLDSEYIQQWLLLDEKRSAMQHLQMEYNTAEVEDWSMEDTENWKKITRFSKLPVSQDYGGLFNDGHKCTVKNLWDFSSQPDSDYNKNSWNEEENQNSLSSDSSWSSTGTNSEGSCASPFENLSKRSSSVLSSENGESAQVGTDFTRDFYRLVKFESSKSLASSSSKSQNGIEQKYQNCDVLPREENAVDREQALQSVLKFIAEQQRYCISRLVQDENCCTVSGEAMAFDSFESESGRLLEHNTTEEGSENASFEEMPIEDETDDGYFSKLSFDNNGNATNTETVTETSDNKSTACFSTEDADPASETCCDSEQNSSSDFKTLFKTCDTCFQSINNDDDGVLEGTDSTATNNICAKCAECYIECLPEEKQCDYSRNEPPPPVDKLTRYPASVPVIQKSSLDTVLEEQEDLAGHSSSGENVTPAADSAVIVMSEQKLVSFHERATSKEVIDELNRMIRKGDEFSEHDRTTPVTELDESFGCTTGWVHVEQDIDFSDPKARANLLDVMLASSSSSSCDSSRNNSDSENGEDDRDYKHLHRLHRFRRQKRASASRQAIMGALRFSNAGIRQSIIGRENFYNRYGEKEREAVASFDFLEELSTTSLSTASEPSDNASCPTPSYSFRSKNGYKYRNRSTRGRNVDCDSCCKSCSCSE